jgi:hypothetical protein
MAATAAFSNTGFRPRYAYRQASRPSARPAAALVVLAIVAGGASGTAWSCRTQPDGAPSHRARSVRPLDNAGPYGCRDEGPPDVQNWRIWPPEGSRSADWSHARNRRSGIVRAKRQCATCHAARPRGWTKSVVVTWIAVNDVTCRLQDGSSWSHLCRQMPDPCGIRPVRRMISTCRVCLRDGSPSSCSYSASISGVM